LLDDGTPCRYSGLFASQLKKALLAISDARTAQLLKAGRVQVQVLRDFESRGYIYIDVSLLYFYFLFLSFSFIFFFIGLVDD
jgi:hypothetical protein